MAPVADSAVDQPPLSLHSEPLGDPTAAASLGRGVHDVELGSPPLSSASLEPSLAMIHVAEVQQRLGEATQAAAITIKSLSAREQLLLVAFTSMMELIMAAQIYTGRAVTAYEISLGAISMGICALLVGRDLRQQRLEEEQVASVVKFLFLWWFAGVIVATFFGDFTTLEYANGYFFTWFSFIAVSVMFFNISSFAQTASATLSDRISGSKYSSVLYSLLLASLTQIGASIRPCTYSCSGLVGFALAVGVVSLVQSIVLLGLGERVSNAGMRGHALFLFCWWCIGAGAATFSTPFVSAGNGYFASLAALLCSIALLRVAISEE